MALSLASEKPNIRKANCKFTLMFNLAPYYEDVCDSGYTGRRILNLCT